MPPGDSDQQTPCSIARSLEIIGDRWTILIIRDAFRGVRRYDELRTDLGIARPVLSDRLKRLVEHGILQKVRYQEHPPRYEYRLTAMGVELSPILVALMRWGDRHLSEEGAPTVLVHEPCGHPLEQGFWCASCQQVFSPTAISSRPGPGRALRSRPATGRVSTKGTSSARSPRPAAR